MRGTIAQEAIVLGFEPAIVRGYGLVVGLRGTGSRSMPPELRAFMRQELSRRGVGTGESGLAGLSVDAVLDSPDTAVVIVEGVIPPGAVGRRVRRGLTLEGTRFDLRVIADPRTDTTNLEGGRLYTCELRPMQPGEVVPPVGSSQASPIAEAKGPVFMNPFRLAEDGAVHSVERTVGRILVGGEVLRDMPVRLRLINPSHARAEILQSAINARFPQEPGQTDQTARGENSETIRITVPRTWRDRPEDFIRLLQSTSLRQAQAEEIARSIGRLLVQNPIHALDASWRWRALGPRALPAVRELYDHPEELPRLASLRAGAALDDPLVVPALIEMTTAAVDSIREEAVRLLAEVRPNLRVDAALRERLADESVDVRLAAYESLLMREDISIRRIDVDDRFELHVVESPFPMIYVAQVGQPRVVIFDPGLRMNEPVFIDTMSGRFIAQSTPNRQAVEIFYRELDGTRVVHEIRPYVVDLARFLGHRTSLDRTDPGIGLTYAESVGLLYQLVREGHIASEFRAEQDRVLAAINRRRELVPIEDRPAFMDEPSPPAAGGSDLDRLAPPPSIGG